MRWCRCLRRPVLEKTAPNWLPHKRKHHIKSTAKPSRTLKEKVRPRAVSTSSRLSAVPPRCHSNATGRGRPCSLAHTTRYPSFAIHHLPFAIPEGRSLSSLVLLRFLATNITYRDGLASLGLIPKAALWMRLVSRTAYAADVKRLFIQRLLFTLESIPPLAAFH